MLRILSKFLILFVILQNVESHKKLNVFHLKSINIYFNNVYERIKSNFFDVQPMMQREKKNVLERVANEFIDSIKKLDQILSDSEYDNWMKDCKNLIKIFEGYALKSNNSVLNSRSISRISAIENNSFVVNSYAAFVGSYPDNGSLKNIIDICPFLPQILKKFYSVVYSDSIIDGFNNLMDDILAEVAVSVNISKSWFVSRIKILIIYYSSILNILININEIVHVILFKKYFNRKCHRLTICFLFFRRKRTITHVVRRVHCMKYGSSIITE